MLNGYCDDKVEINFVNMLSYFFKEEMCSLGFDFFWIICVLMVKILVGICNIVCEKEERGRVLLYLVVNLEFRNFLIF